MTDKVQKIRKEVERLYNQSLADENRQADRGLERAANVSYGKSKVCKELLSFIDSLQEEPKDRCKGCNNVKGCVTCVDGSEWAHYHREEPVSDDLEEEINRYIEPLSPEDIKAAPFCSIEDCAHHFAKWQKQQMMAKATEVTVHIDAGGYPYIPEIELYDYDKDVPLAKEGDKYKVVLIKE